jgi:phosphoribosylamine---glycine ligase
MIFRFEADIPALGVRSWTQAPPLPNREPMTSSSQRILIIGKDARTDAIAAACAASPQQPELFALTELPIPGLLEKCRAVRYGSLLDLEPARDAAREFRPNLAIIGPEEPLEAGYADEFRSLGIAVFGPSKQLAAIESSKSWARSLLDRYGISGNPDYRVFASSDGLRKYMEDLGSFVVKPDGLTGGKGVRVFGEHLHAIDEALDYAQTTLADDGKVQIEQRLDGEEFSLQTITDGADVIHCPVVQDHKRAFDGDRGPNTGGMGSYSCPDLSLPFLDPDDVAVAQSINEQVIDVLARETGEPYRGVLYGGFMATRDGVRLIEYNCRFGDPEAMNILPLLDADFVELCAAAAHGRLETVKRSWKQKATVCKYLVPRDYPGTAAETERIDLPDELRQSPHVRWYWAACREEDDAVFLTSSRSGAFVGIGDSLEEAERIAEGAAQKLEEHNKGSVRHRRDIGSAKLVNRRVDHMRSIRSTHRVAAARS